jgi:hypothetical protein
MHLHAGRFSRLRRTQLTPQTLLPLGFAPFEMTMVMLKREEKSKNGHAFKK